MVGLDTSPEADTELQVAQLAHALVGVVEAHATRAEEAYRAAGAGPADLIQVTDGLRRGELPERGGRTRLDPLAGRQPGRGAGRPRLCGPFPRKVVCNGLHSVAQRCSRRMLVTHDRVGSDEFPLTQEFLAQLLGVRRASVTVAARALQNAGFIRYSRGRVTIIDREGLENASCECDRIIRTEFDRLLR